MTELRENEFPFIIVGGGVSGLLIAHLLKQHGVSFLGFEKADILGGRSGTGHHRLYTEKAVKLFEQALPELKWKVIEESAKLRKKGSWTDLNEESEGFSADEAFYLRHPFFAPEVEYSFLVDKLAEPVKSNFVLRRSVTSIFPVEKKIELQDGTSYHYENLIWCSSLSHLNKMWQGDRTPLHKIMKKGNVARGGIDLEWELSTELVELGNTLIFPFRFKEHKLRALGIQEQTLEGKFLFHLMVFLDEEISEDREEVAKCLRTMRREFEKEFPSLKGCINSEKIVYVPEVSGENATKAKSLEIVPSLYYVGPQIHLDGSEDTVQNLDLVAANCEHLEKALWASPSPG